MSQSAEINIGDILKDCDYEDEYFIVVSKWADEYNYVFYRLRDLSDLSRMITVPDYQIDRWYEVIS